MWWGGADALRPRRIPTQAEGKSIFLALYEFNDMRRACGIALRRFVPRGIQQLQIYLQRCKADMINSFRLVPAAPQFMTAFIFGWIREQVKRSSPDGRRGFRTVAVWSKYSSHATVVLE